MTNDELFGSVAFRFHVSLAPWDGEVSQYAIEIKGEVRVATDDEDDDAEDEVAGNVTLIQFKLAEAMADGAALFWVLDTQEYESLHCKLFDENGQFATHLNIQAPYGDLTIIEELKLTPQFADTPLRRQTIEACISTFASIGVVLIRNEVLRMPPDVWLNQGYVELGHEDWLIRDNVAVRRYEA